MHVTWLNHVTSFVIGRAAAYEARVAVLPCGRIVFCELRFGIFAAFRRDRCRNLSFAEQRTLAGLSTDSFAFLRRL